MEPKAPNGAEGPPMISMLQLLQTIWQC